MEKQVQQWPGYQVNEYKLVLVPHEELVKHIADIRKAITDKYKLEQPIMSIPQVLLVNFKQVQAAEERIINRLKMVAMGSPAFKVELRDYGSFPSHTIFINVSSKVAITGLVKKIRQDTQRLMKLDAGNKPHFMTEPYIGIALKLKPRQFENGWLEYSHKHFTGRFIANHMLLLRRKAGEFKFKPVAGFDFENMPVDIKQGQLF